MCDEPHKLDAPGGAGPPSGPLRGRAFVAVLIGAIVLLAAGILAIRSGGLLLALVGIILVFWGLGALGTLLRLERERRKNRRD